MRRTAAVATALLVLAVPSAPASTYTRHHATVYSTHDCDPNSPGHRTADGVDLRTWKHGVIASNALPWHALIRLSRPLFGHRYFRVRDTGGGGGALFDIFVPCERLDPNWSGDVLYHIVR